ncbi:hypothetical protein EVA_15357 [gut metagenome]|uniref:Uncharacterized protein n=1 Tax=gut metagenome TaxID=749906 RepID=J9C9J1_9ZZZZ
MHLWMCFPLLQLPLQSQLPILHHLSALPPQQVLLQPVQEQRQVLMVLFSLSWLLPALEYISSKK